MGKKDQTPLNLRSFFKTFTMEDINGQKVTITLEELNKRADDLRNLYNTYVHPVEAGGHWKAACYAVVPAALADKVAEAMGFCGSIVDERTEIQKGLVLLFSEGYWAHGF